MLDKKVIRKSLIIILIFLVILIGIKYIRKAFSRYESMAESSTGADLALWIVNDGFTSTDLNIGEIKPLPSKYLPDDENSILSLIKEDIIPETVNIENVDDYIKEIDFYVRNFNENNLISSVPLKYDVKITATTFMPLKYILYKYNEDGTINSTPCDVNVEYVEDEDKTVYRVMTANSSEKNDFHFKSSLVTGTKKEEDKFKLLVWMPDQDSDGIESSDQNYLFADLVEYLKLEIKAEQEIEDVVENTINF